MELNVISDSLTRWRSEVMRPYQGHPECVCYFSGPSAGVHRGM